jgi:hypothetical protein
MKDGVIIIIAYLDAKCGVVAPPIYCFVFDHNFDS